MNFKQPLLLHPLQKHNEGAEDVDGVSLGIFFWAISKKNKKKTIFSRSFSFFFSFFQRPLLLHPSKKHFEGVDNVDGVPLGTFFGAISKN